MTDYKTETGLFLLGDCMEHMKEIPDKSIDLILCDLPYGTTQNKWDAVITFEPLWAEYWRVARPGAVIALTASQPFTSALVMSQPHRFKHEWIWLKNKGSNFANTVREPFKEHESVLIFSEGKWTYNKQMQERTGGGSDRVKYNVAFESGSGNYGKFEGRKDNALPEKRVPSSWQKFNTETGLHPTQKPVALFEYLIRTYTDEGMTVLDNCAGSGTTAIAAERSGRKWVCIERDPEYYAKAVERIQNERGSLFQN